MLSLLPVSLKMICDKLNFEEEDRDDDDKDINYDDGCDGDGLGHGDDELNQASGF